MHQAIVFICFAFFIYIKLFIFKVNKLLDQMPILPILFFFPKLYNLYIVPSTYFFFFKDFGFLEVFGLKLQIG